MDGGASPHAAKGKTKKRKMSMSEGRDKVMEMRISEGRDKAREMRERRAWQRGENAHE